MRKIATERLGYSEKQTDEWANGGGIYEFYECDMTKRKFCAYMEKYIPISKRIGFGRFKKQLDTQLVVAKLLKAFYCETSSVSVNDDTTFVVRYVLKNN